MKLEWKDNLATKVNEIDTQHKELFNRINSLLDAMSKGKGRDVITDIFKFMSDYVVLHFKMEEGLMTKNKYPDFANHKQLHNGFNMKMAELKKRLETEGSTSAVVIDAQPILIDWWYNHINKVDKALGDFLNNKK